MLNNCIDIVCIYTKKISILYIRVHINPIHIHINNTTDIFIPIYSLWWIEQNIILPCGSLLFVFIHIHKYNPNSCNSIRLFLIARNALSYVPAVEVDALPFTIWWHTWTIYTYIQQHNYIHINKKTACICHFFSLFYL